MHFSITLYNLLIQTKNLKLTVQFIHEISFCATLLDILDIKFSKHSILIRKQNTNIWLFDVDLFGVDQNLIASFMKARGI